MRGCQLGYVLPLSLVPRAQEVWVVGNGVLPLPAAEGYVGAHGVAETQQARHRGPQMLLAPPMQRESEPDFAHSSPSPLCQHQPPCAGTDPLCWHQPPCAGTDPMCRHGPPVPAPAPLCRHGPPVPARTHCAGTNPPVPARTLYAGTDPLCRHQPPCAGTDFMCRHGPPVPAPAPMCRHGPPCAGTSPPCAGTDLMCRHGPIVPAPAPLCRHGPPVPARTPCAGTNQPVPTQQSSDRPSIACTTCRIPSTTLVQTCDCLTIGRRRDGGGARCPRWRTKQANSKQSAASPRAHEPRHDRGHSRHTAAVWNKVIIKQELDC